MQVQAQPAAIEPAGINTSARVFILVDGGRVTVVDVPPSADGTHTVIDCDRAEIDPEGTWALYDGTDRDYIRRVLPDIYACYWWKIDVACTEREWELERAKYQLGLLELAVTRAGIA